MFLSIDDTTVTFHADTHQYFTQDGVELESVTRVLSKFKQPFDRQRISRAMATSLAAEKGISVQAAQYQILQGWDKKRDGAADHGTFIHDNIEMALKGREYDKVVDPAVAFVHQLIDGTHRFYPERILYSRMHGIAGTADLVVQRQRSKESPVDFYDYKTNKEKGIVFDTIDRRKKGAIKFYNKFMIEPVDHLEDCNYSHYCLQLSIYAYMAEISHGIKVGRLGIIFIGKTMNPELIPVPYLRSDAKALLDKYAMDKVKVSVYPLSEKERIKKPLPSVSSTTMPVFENHTSTAEYLTVREEHGTDDCDPIENYGLNDDEDW